MKKIVSLILIVSMLINLFPAFLAESTAFSISDGENIIAENQAFKLSIFKNCLKITLTDKRNGKEWSTNLNENDVDTVAQGDNINYLRSHFYLRYYDKKGNLNTMLSYNDSVLKNQASFTKMQNGISIEYEFGKMQRGIESIPSKIKNTSFNKKLISKLSQSDFEQIKGFYKYYKAEDTWMLSSNGKNNVDAVLKLLDKAGYTVDDLLADNKDYGVSSDMIKTPKFKITVEYVLTDKGLTVSIPTKKLVMTKDFIITEIGLLENFSTTKGVKENSYIFVPDGSGAIIDTSTSRNNKTSMILSVYGVDKTIKASKSSFNIQNVALPVFGIKDIHSGLLCIIEEGEATAMINAYKAGYRNNQNSVYVSFRLKNIDYVHIGGSITSTGVPSFQTGLFEGSYKISYFPMNENYDYVGMASEYRDYLTEHNILTKKKSNSSVPLFLETICGVMGYKSFLGISYIGIKKATTFEDNISILTELKESGINDINLKISGWFNNGYKHDYPSKINITSELGGKSKLNKLLKFADSYKINLFPDVDFINSYTTTNGFSTTFTASKSIDMTPALIYDTSYITGAYRLFNGLKPNKRYIISPKIFLSLTDKFLKSYEKLGIENVSLRSSASELYSDYDRNKNIDRTQAQQKVVESFEKLDGKLNKIMVNYGNLYSLKYADCIVNMPLASSWFNFTDYEVPFFQIAVHGSIDYAGTPINLSADTKLDFLKSIEYGAGIYYQVTKSKSSMLNNTEIFNNFSSNFDMWKKNIISYQKAANEALDQVAGQYIARHTKLSDNIYKTTYENGVSIYVNYGAEKAIAEGIKIEPKWFTVVKGV